MNIKENMEIIYRTKDMLNRLLSANCDKPLKDVVKDTDRDYWMNAEESVEYGIVDAVLTAANM